MSTFICLTEVFRRMWLMGLVGDAGYQKDPLGGEAITDAFLDAELLTTAIEASFSGRRPLEAALADYERQRNAVAMPVSKLVRQFASLAPPPPEQIQLFAALRENPAETSRLFGTVAQVVPVSEFFAPANVQRIIERRASA